MQGSPEAPIKNPYPVWAALAHLWGPDLWHCRQIWHFDSRWRCWVWRRQPVSSRTIKTGKRIGDTTTCESLLPLFTLVRWDFNELKSLRLSFELGFSWWCSYLVILFKTIRGEAPQAELLKLSPELVGAMLCNVRRRQSSKSERGSRKH